MIVFTCEDTFEAMMTCIYDAWASKAGHKNIKLHVEPIGNLELFCEYCSITADETKAASVVRSIQQKISFAAYQTVFRCAMSDCPDKLDKIYRFLLLGFSYPDQVLSMLQHPYVNAVFELNRKVTNEAHLFREFVRFQSLSNHVLVAHIEPKANILSFLYPAFDDRMPSENWMIIDNRRRIAAVHTADETTYMTQLSDTEYERLLETESAPDPFIDLWKTFFKTIAIKERTNPVCQRNLIPIWYRKHVTEFLP